MRASDFPDDQTQPQQAAGYNFRAGATIDQRYTLLRLLGKGGMGEVWEARHATLDRLVALKLVRVGGEMRVRLLHEAKLLASLHHSAIVSVHDAGVTADGVGYLAMDVLVGTSLATRLEHGRLAVREGVALFVELLTGLEAAHAAGIVHRDIKPDNVLLVARGGRQAPTLIDFGIAVPIAGAGAHVDLAGTPVYMAPEQLTGQACDQRTDIWSTCVSLYETVTGRMPFSGADLAGTAQQVIELPLSYPTDVADFDGRLWAIVTRGLRKAPADRIGSATELRTALAAWLAQGLGAGTPPPPPRPNPGVLTLSPFAALIRKKLTES